MPESPEKRANGPVTVTVYSNGSKVPDDIAIDKILVEKAVNMIPIAQLEFGDGDPASKKWPVSDSDLFEPGSEVRIDAGYGNEEKTIFEGIVTRHGLKASNDGYHRLLVECRDKSVAMTIGRKNANYLNQKDNEIFSTIVDQYKDLSITSSDTSTEYGELVQYNCTDWDFLLSRAEVNGMIVLIDASEISVNKPEVDGTSELIVTFGEDLLEFHADIDLHNQFAEVKSVCWDPSAQGVIQSSVGTQNLTKQGNIDSSTLAKVLGLSSYDLRTPTFMEQSALQDWASAQQIKSGLSRITGRMKFQGSEVANPGHLLSVSGVGERFVGDVFTSSVSHEIQAGNWITEVNFGMSADWFADRRDLTSPPASGLLPGIEGLQIGIVTKLDDDPGGQNRIQVSLPIQEADTDGVWARLLNFYASSTYGNFFIPEIGDEVLLGYLNNDPSHPVILGSLYSSAHQPPYELTAENFVKAIVTKSQMKLEFDDEGSVITIVTPGGNQIVISDDSESILVQDQTNNKVQLDPSGITLECPKDITVNAQGNISFDAMGDISVSAQGSVSMKGLNIEHDASASLTSKGGASAELSAGGSTVVKGATVLIN